MRYNEPKWTFILIAVCVVVFALEFVMPLMDEYAFVPALAYEKPWTFITSVFLHADLQHLFFNMFALFVFGLYLEPRVSRKQFLFIFFAAGFMGNVAYMLNSPAGTVPAVGASGAIYGIMGLLAILYPTLIVYIGYMPMPMIVAAAVWAIVEFSGMFTPGNIAHEAHLAGLFIGAAYGLHLRKKRTHISL